jgi:hypothetical protein
MVGEAATALADDQGRQLPAVRDVGHSGGPAMRYDEAVRRWVAQTYELDACAIDDVIFDVQYTGHDPSPDAGLQLEIEISMNDCTRHLYVREVSEFGRIITEVLALAG